MSGKRCKPLLFCTVVALMTCCAVSVSSASQLLFVIDPDPESMGTTDTITYNHLVNDLGHTVTVIRDSVATAADAAGKDAVVVSSSVQAADVAAKFLSVSCGVVTWESGIYDDMMFASAGGSTWNYCKSVNITAAGAASPLAAGFTEGQVDVLIDNTRRLGRFSTTGTLGTGAQVIATINELSRTLIEGSDPAEYEYAETGNTADCIVAYEKGATLYGDGAAAGRRVSGFGIDESYAYTTAEGWQLFDASVAWAAAPVPEPATMALLAMGGLAMLRRKRAA